LSVANKIEVSVVCVVYEAEGCVARNEATSEAIKPVLIVKVISNIEFQPNFSSNFFLKKKLTCLQCLAVRPERSEGTTAERSEVVYVSKPLNEVK